MAEYINLYKTIMNFGFEWDDISPTREEFIEFLKKQPVTDAEPIVEAYWIRDYAIENNMADPGEVIARCTNCNWFALHDSYDRLLDYYKRCPHCGAHMKSAKGIDEKLIDVKPYVYE